MSLEKILIVPDTHAPYHDVRAWDLVIRTARKWKPDRIIHMGDLADFYQLSSWDKDPARTETLADEVETARLLREQLDSLGAKRKDFIEGNHEDRIRKYLIKEAPKLFGTVDTDSLLELSENGWTFTPYQEFLTVGAVHFTHDVGGSGKYTTANALAAFEDSVVIGHHHSQAWLVQGDAMGNHHVAAQFGWLGNEKDADYAKRVQRRRKWSLGFGLGYHDLDTGTVFLIPCPIVNYTCLVEGKLYRG